MGIDDEELRSLLHGEIQRRLDRTLEDAKAT
jgi:hypothetical protein